MLAINISLPESMQAFIHEQVAKCGYSTASEYIHHLIRQAQKQVAQEQLEQKLLDGLDSGEPIDVNDEWWEQKIAQLVNDSNIRSNETGY